jgi:hypothetical protein
VAARETVPAGPPVIPAPRRAEPPVAALGTWPCSSCSSANALDQDHCGACGTAFLADVARSEPPLLVLPVVGDVGRLSRTHRVLVGLAVSSAAVVLTGVLGLLLR